MPPLPPITQALLLINVAAFCIEFFLGSWFTRALALWPVGSGLFLPWQIVSYAFLHGSLMHLFFNMLGLWMFGSELFDGMRQDKDALVWRKATPRDRLHCHIRMVGFSPAGRPAAAFDLVGDDGQSKPLLQRAGERPTHRVRLPARRRDHLRDGRASVRCSLTMSAACLVPRGVLPRKRRWVNR